MKWIGICLLFIVCVLAGAHAAHRREMHWKRLTCLSRDTKTLLYWIRTRRMPLARCMQALPQGTVLELMKAEEKEDRLLLLKGFSDEEQRAICDFFGGLNGADMEKILSCGDFFIKETEAFIKTAESEREKARMLRTIGALSGAILAVLLW